MAVPSTHVTGAAEVAAAMQRMATVGTVRALREAHRDTARKVEGKSRGRGTRQQVRAQSALVGTGRADSAEITIRNTAAMPFGMGAYLGATRYRQFPSWVGRSWDLEAGVGPYVVADTISNERTSILMEFEQQLRSAALSVGLDWD